MKIGILGLGKIAEYHINAINEVSGFKIVGGYDINKSQSDKLPDGVKFYGTVDELLVDENIETVLLLVPGGADKSDLSKRILESGKNLITEKPAVENLDELKELEKLATENGVFVHGAFHSRFSPTAREIHRLLTSGDYSSSEIKVMEIWAESPHIVNGEVKSKSSEDTSMHAEGSNIFAEALLYIDNLVITEAGYAKHSDDLPEVHTEMKGATPSGGFRGLTSWVRGFKEKGVRLIFSDGRELVAIHTRQELYNEKADTIFDGKTADPETPRMQKEYNALYQQLAQDIKDGKADNTELIGEVAKLLGQVEEVRVEIDRERHPELFLPKA